MIEQLLLQNSHLKEKLEAEFGEPPPLNQGSKL